MVYGKEAKLINRRTTQIFGQESLQIKASIDIIQRVQKHFMIERASIWLTCCSRVDLRKDVTSETNPAKTCCEFVRHHDVV